MTKIRNLEDFDAFTDATDRLVGLQLDLSRIERELEGLRARRKTDRRAARVEALLRGDDPDADVPDVDAAELEGRRSLLLEAIERQSRTVQEARASARAAVAEDLTERARPIWEQVADHVVGLAECHEKLQALSASSDTGAAPPVAVPLVKYSLTDPQSYAHHALAEIERTYGVKVPARRKALDAIEKRERAEAEEARKRRERDEREAELARRRRIERAAAGSAA